MKNITDHVSNDTNRAITITADEPDQSGASHAYHIGIAQQGDTPGQLYSLTFHKLGETGLTNEALLAILIDRVRGFQSGRFTCRENAIALTKLEEALMWLKHRTASRVARGIEGTHTA
jgi:hypothetical protein